MWCSSVEMLLWCPEQRHLPESITLQAVCHMSSMHNGDTKSIINNAANRAGNNGSLINSLAYQSNCTHCSTYGAGAQEWKTLKMSSHFQLESSEARLHASQPRGSDLWSRWLNGVWFTVAATFLQKIITLCNYTDYFLHPKVSRE